MTTPKSPGLEEIWPPFQLRITAGDLELTIIKDSDLTEFVGLALTGVHDPDRMPFSTPWTDADPADLPAAFVRYHWGDRAAFLPERFNLLFAVRREGELVGTQGVGTHDFALTRTGETGSWLGLRFQGQGIGTRMRQAVCAFMFDELGATQLTSGAFVDNPASLAVSRKVGYRTNGTNRMVRRPGECAEHQKLVLDPEDLVRGDPLTVDGATPLREFLRLDQPEVRLRP